MVSSFPSFPRLRAPELIDMGSDGRHPRWAWDALELPLPSDVAVYDVRYTILGPDALPLPPWSSDHKPRGSFSPEITIDFSDPAFDGKCVVIQVLGQVVTDPADVNAWPKSIAWSLPSDPPACFPTADQLPIIGS